MGMVIKIYIGDIGQEVNIATLNSDKTQSVTITSKLIEDYRNKVRSLFYFILTSKYRELYNIRNKKSKLVTLNVDNM